jgi:hypothetical protein
MLFTFPEAVRWNPERQAVEFGGRDWRVPGGGAGAAARVPTASAPSVPRPSGASKPATYSGPGSRPKADL